MRLISKLEKFAEECYNQGYDIGATETIEMERG
jgi:regulator of RNase E activity RraB